MTEQQQAAMRQLLYCVEAWDRGCDRDAYWHDIDDALAAGRQALEQPADDPVAWYDEKHDYAYTKLELGGDNVDGLIPLYKSWAKGTNAVMRSTKHPQPCNLAEDGVCEALECCKQQPADEPVAWAGWHKSTDDVMLFKTKADAIAWRDQYKEGFALIQGLICSQPAARAIPEGWSVYNSGAEVASDLTFEEAWDYLTPERLARQWCAVCVVDQSNMPKLREKNGGAA